MNLKYNKIKQQAMNQSKRGIEIRTTLYKLKKNEDIYSDTVGLQKT